MEGGRRMAESVRPRFAVDLDEIERQLAHAQSEPVPGYTSGRNDPLAELARIVGQDDPFQSILAADRATRPASRDAAVYDDIFVARDQSGRPHAGQDPRHSFDPRSPTELDAAPGRRAVARFDLSRRRYRRRPRRPG